MKKIAFILALIMILGSALWGCDTAETDTTGQAAENTEETNELRDTVQNNEGIDNTTEISLPEQIPNNSYEYSIEDDGYGKHFIYIEKWNKTLEITDSTYLVSDYHPIWSDYYNISAWVEDDTATVAFHEHDRDSITITTHHFNRNSNSVQTYSVTFPIWLDREQNEFMINMIDKDHGYFFCSPPRYDLNGEELDWPFIRYETTDGGKTWGEPEVLQSSGHWKFFPDHMKFLTKDVGIISYRISNGDFSLFPVVASVTTDGGKTWNSITNLPYPEKMEGITDDYSCAEIEDFEKTEDGYVLKVMVRDGSTGMGYIVSFIFDNLKSWKLLTCVRDER